MEDGRNHPRNRTYLSGQVAYRQRYCALDCLVRDWSPAGARLVFSEELVLPTKFDLVIPHKRDSQPARIVWRKGTEVGVRFLDNPDERPSVEVARSIQLLKKKNAALTRRIAELSEPVC